MGGLFGGRGGDGGAARAASDAAAQARASEEARKSRIGQGMTDISSAFSQFNPEYYEARGQAYQDYADPQLAEQYEDAQRELIYALSRSGNLASSAAAEKRGELQEEYGGHRQRIANKALALRNQARSDVEANRARLVSELQMTADPAAAASMAHSKAAALATRPSFDPIGQLFQNVSAGMAQTASSPSTKYSGMANLLFGDKKKKDSNIIVE